MKPTRQIVHEIQQLLIMEGSIGEEEIAKVAAAYAEACQQVSDRASQCLELLRRGMRDKAVELANAPPDLRSEMETLQFPELEEWVVTCEMVGVSTTNNLDTDAIWSILKELYSQNQAYDQLLASYRRMALGRAPLGQRIRVLRQLCHLDPKQQFWMEDLRQFEAAYVQELLVASEQANQQNDYETLKAILAELQSPEWLKPRPSKAAYAVEQIILPHRKRYAGDRFFELGGYLNNAHSSLNEEACRHLVMQWQAVTTETGVEPTQAQAEKITPVLAWLDDLESARQKDANFRHACANLDAALDDNQERPILEKLGADVLRWERGMPELLETRFNSRLAQFTRQGTMRFTLRLVAVISAVLLVAAGTTALVLWRNHERSQTRWQEHIAAALQKDDLVGAAKLFNALEAEDQRILLSPELQNLRHQYDSKCEAEQKRQSDFKAAMVAVERAGVEIPDSEALGRANFLAEKDDEKAEVEAWRGKIQRRVDEKRMAREAEYEKSLQALENSHYRLLEADPSKSADLSNQLLAATKRLLGAGGGSQDQTRRTTEIVQALLKAQIARVDEADRQKKITEALVKIQGLVDRPDELVQSMNAFIDSYPEHPLADDFAKVLLAAGHSAGHWKGVVTWHDMLRDWGGNVRESGADLLKGRAEQVSDYLKAYPDGPYTAAAQDCHRYLEAGTKAWSAAGLKCRAPDLDIMNNEFMTKAQVAHIKDGRTYYLRGSDDLVTETINDRIVAYHVRYIVNATTLEQVKPGIALKAGELEGDVGPAPHVVMANAVLKELNDFHGPGWETLYLRLAEKVRSSDAVDPILRAILVKKFLADACECAPFKAEEIQQQLKRFEGLNLDVVWLNPSDADANASRPEAAAALKAMGSLDDLIKQIDQWLAVLNATAQAYRPVCVFFNVNSGVRMPQVRVQGPIYMLDSKAGQVSRFLKVGEIKDAKFLLDQQMAANIPQGCLLFQKGL